MEKNWFSEVVRFFRKTAGPEPGANVEVWLAAAGVSHNSCSQRTEATETMPSALGSSTPTSIFYRRVTLHRTLRSEPCSSDLPVSQHRMRRNLPKHRVQSFRSYSLPSKLPSIYAIPMGPRIEGVDGARAMRHHPVHLIALLFTRLPEVQDSA